MGRKRQELKCLICGSKEIKFLFSIKHGNLYKCISCNFAFVNPIPKIGESIYQQQDYFTISEFYNEKNPIESLLKHRSAEEIEIIPLLKKFCKGKRLLDIGCSNGILLNKARNAGYEVYGIEPNKKAVEFAKKKLKLKNIYNTCSLKRFNSNFFDCIVMSQIIEHLPNPQREIEEVQRILKQEGILIISTPDVESKYAKVTKEKWPMFNRLGHICFFSEKSLKVLFERNGFKIIDKPKYMGYLYLPNHLLRFIDQKISPLRWIYTYTLIGGIRKFLMDKFKLGDNLLIIAEKIK